MGGNLRFGRRFRRRLITAIAALAMVGAASAVASADVASGFVDEIALSGLTQPTNISFAPDGRVFVAEKSGLIQVFESLNDPNPHVFADLRSEVNDYWDRGLLGLAVDPDFPDEPYVYALYTHGTPLDPSLPSWGDVCPNPPGDTDDGCVVSGRLTRLTAGGDPIVAMDQDVLITDWCQQFPSHSVGDLLFGTDGALYVSGGDGASFGVADYGQRGGDPDSPTPLNPCGDPPVPSGSAQTPPTAEGGALRAQDLRTPGDPVTLNGTVARIDSDTGEAMPTIVAYGLRNPFRLALDPSDDTIYIGDVGWGLWEEVNRLPDPTGEVRNFGWPCYEGGYDTAGGGTSLVQGDYDSLDLNICENLYGEAGAVTAPLFAYHHADDITGADDCPPATPPAPTSSSISGIAFYSGGGYPGAYEGALFGADYSRNCIWVMYRDGSDNLDPTTTEVFESDAGYPVDLEIGHGGDLFYVDIGNGSIHRIRYLGSNTPPIAVISADVTSGDVPLEVNFDAGDSSDLDGTIVSYEWDLDGDGAYGDATEETPSWTYDPGAYTTRLRVTDNEGAYGFDTLLIQAANTVPTAVIDTPSASAKWHVGESFSFSGHGTDPEDGSLPASALTWALVLHHCEEDGSCHEHVIQGFSGVTGGNFAAPDHEYPSWLELRLTVEDQYGSEDTKSVELQPETVDLTFATSPAGLDVSFFGVPETAPFTTTWIVGADIDLSTSAVQQALGSEWQFVSWSNGGTRVQSFTAPASDTTYTATFEGPAPTPGSPDPADEMFFYRTTGSFRYYDVTPTGGLVPIYVGTGYSKGWDSISAVDLNGDGRDEMFFYRSSDGAFRYYNMNSNGKLGSAIRTGSGYSRGWDSITAVDLDADGQDEMFFYRSSDGAFRYYNISPGASLGGPMLSGTGYSRGWDSITAVDLNGDGRDEMFFYRSSDGAFRYYNMNSNGKLGSAIRTGSGYSKGWDSITAVDLDGDVQDEMFFYRESGSFRYYNVTPSGGLVPISSGNGYSKGWDSITAVGLD